MHWKTIYKNVYKGFHKRTENNWNSRRSRSRVFCKKSVLRNCAKFTRKHLRQSFLFNKVAGLKPVDLLRKRLWYRSFPVNFVKFLRTPLLVEHLWWLLLGHFLGCQSTWCFSWNAIFSRMNVIFLGDAGDVTLRCTFLGQGDLYFFAGGRDGVILVTSKHIYRKYHISTRFLIKIIFFDFPPKEKILYFWKK